MYWCVHSDAEFTSLLTKLQTAVNLSYIYIAPPLGRAPVSSSVVPFFVIFMQSRVAGVRRSYYEYHLQTSSLLRLFQHFQPFFTYYLQNSDAIIQFGRNRISAYSSISGNRENMNLFVLRKYWTGVSFNFTTHFPVTGWLIQKEGKIKRKCLKGKKNYYKRKLRIHSATLILRVENSEGKEKQIVLRDENGCASDIGNVKFTLKYIFLLCKVDVRLNVFLLKAMKTFYKGFNDRFPPPGFLNLTFSSIDKSLSSFSFQREW